MLLWTVCIEKGKLPKYRPRRILMTEPGNENNQGDRPGMPPPPGVPRWLKVSGIVVAAVVLVALIVSLATGTEHGPDLHESWVAVLLGRKGNIRPLRWH
jgi:hypothetical protein